MAPPAKAALGGGPGGAFLFSIFCKCREYDLNWCIQSSNRPLLLGPGAVTARVPPALEPRAQGASPSPRAGWRWSLHQPPPAPSSGQLWLPAWEGGGRRGPEASLRGTGTGGRPAPGSAPGSWRPPEPRRQRARPRSSAPHHTSARRGGDPPARPSPRSRRLLSPAAPRASQSRTGGAPLARPGAWVELCRGARENRVSFVGRRPQPGEGLGSDPARGPERGGRTPGRRTES